MEHPAVAEVVVIPDATAGEVVKAFVAVKDGFEPNDKVIVMATLESEDTSWVADKLPEYAGLNYGSPSEDAVPLT